jgi:hypothetical protein
VQPPGDLLAELRRIVSGTLLAVSVFYPAEDPVHAPAIREAGMEGTLFRSAALEAFAAAGWEAAVENERQAAVRPTPVGEILAGFKVDSFPLTETTQTSCLLVGR